MVVTGAAATLSPVQCYQAPQVVCALSQMLVELFQPCRCVCLLNSFIFFSLLPGTFWVDVQPPHPRPILPSTFSPPCPASCFPQPPWPPVMLSTALGTTLCSTLVNMLYEVQEVSYNACVDAGLSRTCWAPRMPPRSPRPGQQAPQQQHQPSTSNTSGSHSTSRSDGGSTCNIGGSGWEQREHGPSCQCWYVHGLWVEGCHWY